MIMGIPEIDMISDFEAGMKCLQTFPQVYSFWKWGALIFGIFAAFSSIIRRIKLILIRFHTVKPSSHQNEEMVQFGDDGDDDDDEISLASSDDDDHDDERVEDENRLMTSFGGQRRFDGDFRVKGTSHLFRNLWRNGHLRRRICVGGRSEFASDISVVRLSDSLGLSLDFDEELRGPLGVVSTWDCGRGLKENGFPGGVWNIPDSAVVATAGLVLSAEGNPKGGGVILGGYDTRMRRCVPALYAEWISSDTAAEKVDGVDKGDVGKVYVRDDSGVLTVGDVRNVRRPLVCVRESDGSTWWNADAVVVENE
ncbi:hypothetical protein OROGR_000604 [Orobanche gracilis]